MYVSGDFDMDKKMDQVKLAGDYFIQEIKNEVNTNVDDLYQYENIPCQAVYTVGNVLCRSDTENLKDLIKVFIRYTYDPCNDLDLDRSIQTSKVMRGGTICPTKKRLFVYKSKVFVAYGRYIFGYDKSYVTFRRTIDEVGNYAENGNSVDESNEDKISGDKIILNSPDYEGDCNDYVYSFMIYDAETKVLDCFGLYR